MSLSTAFRSAFNSTAAKTIFSTIGAAAAGEIGARLSGVSASQGYQPTQAAQAQQPFIPASITGAGFGFPSATSSFLPIAFVGGVVLLAVFLLRKK